MLRKSDTACELPIQSILDNDSSTILEVLKNDPNIVNNKISYTVFTLPNELPKTAAYTPLQIAVYTFNYDLTKLLLEHEADPNILNSDGQSTLEILMESIGKDISEVPVNPKLQDNLIIAEKILDTLLCFGLEPNFEWTKGFTSGYESLELLASILFNNNYNSLRQNFIHQEIINSFVEMAIENKTLSPRKNRETLAELTQMFDTDAKSQDDDVIDLAKDYVLTFQTLRAKISAAAQEIHREKLDYVATHQKEVNLAFNEKLPVVLGNIISQYALETSKHISENRVTKKSTVGFWQHQDPIPLKLSEEEIQTIQQDVRYKTRLTGFFNKLYKNQEMINNKIISIINDYVTAPKKP